MLCLDIVCLFGRAPLCFTFNNQMNRTVASCLQLSSPLQAYFLLCGVLAKPDWTEIRAPQEADCLPDVWLNSKRLSACVSHSAAALCVCVSDSRTATYCVVLVFAFEKAATVSLVVVQQ